MQGASQARREHAGLDVLLPVRGHHVAHDLHPVLVDVIEPPDERTDDVRADRRREKGLVDAEAQRHVHPGPLTGQDLSRREAVWRHGHLHDHVLVP